MPVHLGSMGESIKTVIRANAGKMKPGDVYVLNAPYNGGTHLPDVTVITPVFDAAGEILFYVGSQGPSRRHRRHHAGLDAAGLEGGRGGRRADRQLPAGRARAAFARRRARALLASGRYPVRNVEQNIADLRAQIAANEKGVQELRRMVEHFGLDVVRAYMRPRAGQRRGIGAARDRAC